MTMIVRGLEATCWCPLLNSGPLMLQHCAAARICGSLERCLKTLKRTYDALHFIKVLHDVLTVWGVRCAGA